MKSSLTNLAIGFTVVASSISASHAEENKGGLFVEPILTYERGRGSVDFPAPLKSSDTKVDGFGIGARLGFHVYKSVFLGADGRYSMPQFKDTALDQKIEAKAWNYGPVVGIQMPTDIALRIWGGYIIDGQLDPEKDQKVDEKFSQAKGYRLGAGIKLGIVSLNVEYQTLKYEKTEIQEVGVFTPGYKTSGIELNNDTWIASVSFPISI